MAGGRHVLLAGARQCDESLFGAKGLSSLESLRLDHITRTGVADCSLQQLCCD